MAATVTNSLVWGNTAQTGPQINGPATVSFSDVQGGFAGTANIAADPLFVGADDTAVRVTLLPG